MKNFCFKPFSLLLLLLGLLLGIAGCKKIDISVEEPEPLLLDTTSGVYMVGTVTPNSDVMLQRAYNVLWKDGKIQQYLSDTSGDQSSYGRGYVGTTSVFVAGNDVYVAGYEDWSAQLWKNGIRQLLPLPSNSWRGSRALGVFVSEGDVYVVADASLKTPGENNNAGSDDVILVWKNGTIIETINDSDIDVIDYKGRSIFVENKDIYITGTYRSKIEVPGTTDSIWKENAVLWKNGTKQLLTFPDPSNNEYATSASSVFVKNGNVFVAGSRELIQFFSDPFGNGTDVSRTRSATIWKNEQIQQGLIDDNSSESSLASSIFISGDDIYILGSIGGGYRGGYDGGYYGPFKDYVWKNGEGQPVDPADTYEEASSLFVSGNDVYVTGRTIKSPNINGVARLWKNGIVQPLDSVDIFRASNIACIFVKP